MNIAIIADNNKKELMVQFCIAYCGILERHNLFATHITGKHISDATGLKLETFLTGGSGGIDQIASRVAYNEIDAVIYFRTTEAGTVPTDATDNLLRLCDLYNIPVATNIATAEALIHALERGDLDWRELVH